MRLNGGNRGFTLIELMISLVIIGVLSTLAVPNFSRIQQKSKETSVIGLARSLQVAVESYSLVNGSFPAGDAAVLPTFLETLNKSESFMVLPKNPFTGGDYTKEDASGKIVYTYDSDTDIYVIEGFGKGNSASVIALRNS